MTPSLPIFFNLCYTIWKTLISSNLKNFSVWVCLINQFEIDMDSSDDSSNYNDEEQQEFDDDDLEQNEEEKTEETLYTKLKQALFTVIFSP